mgnify:CR=1 FL=1
MEDSSKAHLKPAAANSGSGSGKPLPSPLRHRFEAFLNDVASWERSYGKLSKIDLRFEGKVFMEPLEEAPARRSR